MLTRVVAALLALLLCWSGFATQEQLAGSGGPELAITHGGGAHAGSVDEHHLDDQPGQASAEAALDVPEWSPAPSKITVTGRSGSKVPPGIASAPATFTADAPMRPPRAA